MITAKQGMLLSAIIGKIGLKRPDGVADQEQLGLDIILQILSNAYKAEKEVYAFIANIKGCTLKEAENVNLAELLSEVMGDSGMRDFLSSVTTSQPQG